MGGGLRIDGIFICLFVGLNDTSRLVFVTFHSA
jgi:hypothetical protein